MRIGENRSLMVEVLKPQFLWYNKAKMKTNHKHMRTRKAFTLIEVMVTMFVIGLLAGVVVAGVAYVKNKGKDARIIHGVNQIMQMAQSDVMGGKDYSAWFSNPGGPSHIIDEDADCNAAFSDSTVRSICKKIIADIGPGALAAGPLWAGPGPTNDKLSIMAWLPNAEKYFCIGSSGKSSAETSNNGSGCGGGVSSWSCGGCILGN